MFLHIERVQVSASDLKNLTIKHDVGDINISALSVAVIPISLMSSNHHDDRMTR